METRKSEQKERPETSQLLVSILNSRSMSLVNSDLTEVVLGTQPDVKETSARENVTASPTGFDMGKLIRYLKNTHPMRSKEQQYKSFSVS